LGTFSGVAARGVTLAAIGFVVLPALPVILTEAERLAGAAAGTAGALIWMMGNLGGVIVALLVGALVDSPFAAFTVMAAVSVAGIPLALRVRSVTPSPELRA
ncbi:MAG TPA: hypothetical protein VH025_09065, partial [Solirubrobacteraceae bacterium]|nr:hypothetical protein [Solirubrobacteraceae bacterium]